MKEILKLVIIVVLLEILIGFCISSVLYMVFTLAGKCPGVEGFLLGWTAFTGIGLFYRYWELSEWMEKNMI